MSSPALVTVIAVALVVIVLAGFLIAIARVLMAVDRTLSAVVDAVGTIATKTEPVAYVVDSLTSNLGAASGLLTSLLVSKVGADGATALVASVDPLGVLTAAPDRSSGPRIHYERASEYAGVDEARPDPVAAPVVPAPDTREPFTGGGGGRIRFGGRTA